MNITKQPVKYWANILAWAGAWALFHILCPPENRNVVFCSVNIPKLIMLILFIWGMWLVATIINELERKRND